MKRIRPGLRRRISKTTTTFRPGRLSSPGRMATALPYTTEFTAARRSSRVLDLPGRHHGWRIPDAIPPPALTYHHGIAGHHCTATCRPLLSEFFLLPRNHFPSLGQERATRHRRSVELDGPTPIEPDHNRPGRICGAVGLSSHGALQLRPARG